MEPTVNLTLPQQRLLRRLAACPSLWACMDNGRNNSDRTLGALVARGMVELTFSANRSTITGHRVTARGHVALGG